MSTWKHGINVQYLYDRSIDKKQQLHTSSGGAFTLRGLHTTIKIWNSVYTWFYRPINLHEYYLVMLYEFNFFYIFTYFKVNVSFLVSLHIFHISQWMWNILMSLKNSLTPDTLGNLFVLYNVKTTKLHKLFQIVLQLTQIARRAS